jgi:hypothetical protein
MNTLAFGSTPHSPGRQADKRCQYERERGQPTRRIGCQPRQGSHAAHDHQRNYGG